MIIDIFISAINTMYSIYIVLTSVFCSEAALVEAGFVDVRTEATDPRHRTVMAKKHAMVTNTNE
jgi:hypothetical protein